MLICCFGKKKLFFPIYFLVSTQKTEANFQTFQWIPYFSYFGGVLLHFLLWKVYNWLKLNLCACYFFFGKKVLFKLILLVCSLCTRQSFSLVESGLSIWTRQILYVSLNYYMSDRSDLCICLSVSQRQWLAKIYCKSYLLKTLC